MQSGRDGWRQILSNATTELVLTLTGDRVPRVVRGDRLRWRHREFRNPFAGSATERAGELVDVEGEAIDVGPHLVRIRTDEGIEWEAPRREVVVIDKAEQPKETASP